MKKFTLFVFLCFFVCSLAGQTIDVTLTLKDNCNKNASTINPEPESDLFLKLFPNPSKGVFTLTAAFKQELGKTEILIYNIDGRLVQSESIYCDSKKLVKQIDVSNLPAGIYIIEINTNGQEISSKFVNQKK